MAPPLVTWSEHGAPFIAAVENGPLCATQFHPEKSGDAGGRLLRNWVNSLHSSRQRTAAGAQGDSAQGDATQGGTVQADTKPAETTPAAGSTPATDA